MINILHIITGLSDGGAEAVLFRLCVHDQRDRHTVISLINEGKYGRLLRQAGIKVYCLGMPKGKISPAGIACLWRIVRAEKPEVVQTWMYHADLIGGITARLAGVRYVFWGIRHSNLMPGKSKRSTIWIARLCAVLSHFVPYRIICCSRKAALIHQELGYSARKFNIIPNGYNLEDFMPDDREHANIRDELWVDEDTPLIGMVARFNPQKDHANLISALGRLDRNGRKFRCALIGIGMDSNNEKLIKLLTTEGVKERICLLGRRTDIPAVMNALDIHVLSSAYGEAFPNVLAEAMACGTPCVTTDVGDASEIVGDTGWVVPPSDPEKLASGLDAALDEWGDFKAWDERQKIARQRIVEHFSLEKMVKAYRDVWA